MVELGQCEKERDAWETERGWAKGNDSKNGKAALDLKDGFLKMVFEQLLLKMIFIGLSLNNFNYLKKYHHVYGDNKRLWISFFEGDFCSSVWQSLQLWEFSCHLSLVE